MYHDNVHLHPSTTVPSYTLRFLRYDQQKILKVKVTIARSKITSRSHHNVGHPPTPPHPQKKKIVSTKYQPLTPYRFQGIAQTRF